MQANIAIYFVMNKIKYFFAYKESFNCMIVRSDKTGKYV